MKLGLSIQGITSICVENFLTTQFFYKSFQCNKRIFDKSFCTKELEFQKTCPELMNDCECVFSVVSNPLGKAQKTSSILQWKVLANAGLA